MNNIELTKDILVVGIKASSYPMGIQAAHQKLHSLINIENVSGYYGMSRPEGSEGIVYYACASLRDGAIEANNELIQLTIKKGHYTSTNLMDYMQSPQKIGEAFSLLLKHPKIDPTGYCVEDYVSKTEMICMVRII